MLAMGFCQELARPAPPTTTDNIQGEQKISSIGNIEESPQRLDVETGRSQHHAHPDLERRVVKKLDLTVVPLVSALCLSSGAFHLGGSSTDSCKDLLAFLDRSNIGYALFCCGFLTACPFPVLADLGNATRNARIAGMTEDLNLDKTADRYQWLLNIFYISYIVFEFQALMWKIIRPNRWAAFVVFGWGVAATLQAATHNWESEMVCRWFLGNLLFYT